MVEGAALRQVRDQRRVGLGEAHLVPADVRQLQRAGARSGRTSPATRPRPAAPPSSLEELERQLHAEADAEHRRARRDALAQQLVQAELAQVAPSRAGTRRRRARTSPSAARSSAWSRVTLARRADVLERLLDRAAVAHAVVDDRDLDRLIDRARSCRSASPSCSARRVSLGSIATAWRSARANALNAASIMWWALLPGLHAQVQRQLGRVGERAEELLGQLVLEAARRARRQLGLEQRERTPGDVDRAARARLVHRHRRRAVAGDAARSPSASSSAWPSTIAVSSAVWCAPVCRSPLTFTSRSMRPWRASRSSMWSRKPTPVLARARAGAVERQRQAHVGLARACARSLRSCDRLISRLDCRRMRASIDSRVHLEALRARDRRARARRASPAAVGVDPHLGHACGGSGAARASRRSARRRPSAGRGWSRRRSRRTRSRCRRPTNTQPARAAPCGASASASAPISCRCSGANAFASASAVARVGDLDERERRVADRRALRAEPLERRGERVADRPAR